MGKKVLVVDDDMICMKSVQRYLSEEKFEVISALSGIQAVNIIEDMKVDLLLLDIEMPEMNGFVTLEHIRKLPNGEKLPVIFFTGRTDMATIKQCSLAGGMGYIAKPVVREILHEKIREVFAADPSLSEEKTVLFVSDHLNLLKLVKHELQQNFKVIVVNGAKSAVDYLSGHSVDVVFWQDGMSLEDRQAILGAMPAGVPLILVAETEETTTQKKESSGGVVCIASDADVSKLPDVIAQALQK